MRDLEFFDEVFDPSFCRFLLTNARVQLERGTEFHRSNFHWQPSIRKSSAVVLVRDYDPTLSQLIVDGLIDRGVNEHRDYHVMNYAWTRLSFIPWHDDHGRNEAITVYLNEEWDIDWGGLFMYRDGSNQIRAYAPIHNCGLKNNNNVLHSTTPVSLDAAEPRFTVQLFSRKQT